MIFQNVENKRCKIFIYKFLIRALERPKDVNQTLIEKRNNIEFMIDCIYKFKTFLVFWRLFFYIY